MITNRFRFPEIKTSIDAIHKQVMRNSSARTFAIGITSLVFVVALASGCRTRPQAANEADLAIESVTVIDAVGERRPDHRVVLQGDLVVWVGPMSAPGPVARRVIDGRDGFVIPGLWDAHVHFIYDEGMTREMPDLFLDWGITSVRDTGGDLAKLVSLRERWQTQGRQTPRFYLSGPLLDGQHVVYDGATPAQPPLGISVPDVARAAQAVEELEAGGADFIKIYELVSPETFHALVAAARSRGLPIASHVPLSMTADEAGPLVDSMEHLRNVELACARDWSGLARSRREQLEGFDGDRGYPLRRSLHLEQRLSAIETSDEIRCAEVIASLRNTMQVPTLRLNAFNHSRPHERDEWRAAVKFVPADVRVSWDKKIAKYHEPGHVWKLEFANWSLGLVGRMNRAGVPIAAGTDTPIGLAIPGESLHRELELLVESGLTPRQALFAATVAPARFFNLEGEMGQVAVGMRADLILLRADPMIDIRNTRTIQGVVSQGRWRIPRSR